MSGGSGTVTTYSPSADAPCYDPRMTRAQALARIAAGTLRENCVVVITDGPTIGQAPLTSPTEIELNPTSPTQLGMAARVKTNYDTTPWAGLYDVNLGAGTGLIRLEDNAGNILDDETAFNVEQGFPWGYPTTVKENWISGTVDLTGWNVAAVAGTQIIGNRFDGLTGIVLVDLSAMTGGSVYRNNIKGSGKITLIGNIPVFANNQLEGQNSAITVNRGGATGTFQIDSNRIEGGSIVNINPAGALNFVFDENRIWDAFRVNVIPGAAVGQFSINGNEMRGAATTAPANPSLLVDKTAGVFNLDECDFDNDTDSTAWRWGGSSASDNVRLTHFTCPAVATPMIFTGSGNISISSCEVNAVTATINNAGGLGLTRASVTGGSIVTNGAGRISIADSQIRTSAISNGAGSTRALQISSSDILATPVQQNRSGGAQTDVIEYARIQFAFLQLAGAASPGINQFFDLIQGSGSFLFTDPAGALHVSDLVVTATGTFNSQAGSGPHSNIRVGGGGTLNTGAFAHNQVTYEIQGAQTLTAANTNRLRNVGFTNTV